MGPGAKNVLTNNETLVSVSTLDKDKDLSKGVAIGSILHTDDNSHLEVVRYCEGSGFWKLAHTPYTTGKNSAVRIAGIDPGRTSKGCALPQCVHSACTGKRDCDRGFSGN